MGPDQPSPPSDPPAPPIDPDTTAPDTSINSGPSGLTNNNDPSFTYSGAPGGDVDHFECSLDAAAFATCPGAGTNFTNLADAARTFRVRAVDASGNADASPASRSFTIDATAPSAPSLTGTTPGSPSNADTSPDVQGTAEAGAQITVHTSSNCVGSQVGSGTTSDLEGAGITSNLSANTTSQLFAKATDAAGNASACSTSVSYIHDSIAPDAPILTHTVPASPSQLINPSLIGTAEAGTTIKKFLSSNCTSGFIGFSNASTLDQNGGGIPISPLTANATNLITVLAIDGAGNESPCSAPFTYTHDTLAPDTTITGGPSGPFTQGGATTDTTPTFTFSSEAGATFQCRVDSDSFVACNSGSFTTANIPPSNTIHTFEVVATDAAGNGDPSPATQTFRVRTDADADTFASIATGGTDCNDSVAGINPAAFDGSVNGTDEDCDGTDGS